MDGDGILLCTDGLHGFALDRQIEDAIVCNNLDPQKVTTGLVNLAIGTYFSNDNVTVQYVQIGKPKALNSVRPAFGRAKRASESTRPGNSPQDSAARRKRSLFSKVLLWLNTLLILAAVGWGALHLNSVAKPLELARISLFNPAQAPKPAPIGSAAAAESTPGPLKIGIVLPETNVKDLPFDCYSSQTEGAKKLPKIVFVAFVAYDTGDVYLQPSGNVTCAPATQQQLQKLKEHNAVGKFDAIIELKKKLGPQK
jgi:hypothetical protein